MMNRQQRLNDKFRQKLQQGWIDEAKSSPGPVPVDADQLWHRIDQQLTREKLSVVSPKPARHARLHWTLLSAAALAFLVIWTKVEGPHMAPSSTDAAADLAPSVDAAEPLEVLVSDHRKPLQTPSRLETPRCDQSRQSCLFVAFL